jgi:hypothetical protein
MVFKKLIIILLISTIIPRVVFAGQGSWFVFTQLKHTGNWDPYPESFTQVYYYLQNTTSLRVKPNRRVVTADDEEIFYSPFLLFTGKGSYPEFTEDQIINLKRYILGGGILLIDTAGDEQFSQCADKTIKKIFPEREYEKVKQDNALFRSFYLVDYVSGRTIRSPYLEGITINSRLAVIKSHNDIMGIWPRDNLGNWKFPLIPDKYGQRKEAIKLTLNIMMYSVCGTYKSDPVHQPFIKRKLGR